MKKRIWYIAVLALLVAVLVIACGKKEAETQGGSTDTTVQQMNQPPGDNGGMEQDTGDTTVDTTRHPVDDSTDANM